VLAETVNTVAKSGKKKGDGCLKTHSRACLASDGFLFPSWQPMKTPPRKLTVEDFNPKGRFALDSRASLLRLKGCWLKEAGFHAGDQVLITNLSPGVIELRVCSPVLIDVSYDAAMKRLTAVLNDAPKTLGPA
jgi:hypothetical protein